MFLWCRRHEEHWLQCILPQHVLPMRLPFPMAHHDDLLQRGHVCCLATSERRGKISWGEDLWLRVFTLGLLLCRKAEKTTQTIHRRTSVRTCMHLIKWRNKLRVNMTTNNLLLELAGRINTIRFCPVSPLHDSDFKWAGRSGWLLLALSNLYCLESLDQYQLVTAVHHKDAHKSVGTGVIKITDYLHCLQLMYYLDLLYYRLPF